MLSFRQFSALQEAAQSQSRRAAGLPAVLIFKRKAIRVFPHGQEVSSYYSDQLKKTVLFPNTY